MSELADASVRVRDDLIEMEARSFAALAAPGGSLSGEERVSLAEVARGLDANGRLEESPVICTPARQRSRLSTSGTLLIASATHRPSRRSASLPDSRRWTGSTWCWCRSGASPYSAVRSGDITRASSVARSGGSSAAELEKLAGIHKQDVLIDEEFASQKSKVPGS